MRAQRTEHAPDLFERRIFQRLFLVLVAGNINGQDDDAVLLAVGFADGAAHGLNDVHLRFFRINERHAVQRANVNAFTQAAGIGHNPTRRRLNFAEPVEDGVAFVAGHVARNQFCPNLAGRNVSLRHPADELLELVGKLFGAGDPTVKRDDAAQVIFLDRLGHGDVARQCAGIGDGFAVHRDEHALLGILPIHRVIHADDFHAVIGQQLEPDGLGEFQFVEDRAENFMVIHRNQFQPHRIRPRL